MKGISLIVLVGIICFSLCNPLKASPEQLQKFVRGVYFPFERLDWVAQKAKMGRWDFVDKLFSQLRHRYRIDAIWVVNIGTQDARQLCQLAQKHGVGVFVTPESVIWWRHLRGKEAAFKIAKHAVETLADLPSLWAYVLVDEARVWEMAQMENIRAELASLDKNRISLMVTMTGDVEGAARYTQLPILVCDIYPFFAPKSPNGPNTPASSRTYYITCTERLVELAEATGKKAWVMPQVFAEIWGKWHYDEQMNAVIEPNAYWHWRMPTIGETRWQIWQAIAAGAKGVVFFVLFPEPNDRKPDDPSEGPIPTDAIHPTWPRVSEKLATNAGTALLYNDGTPTKQLLTISETFAFLEPHLELLWRLKPCFPVAFADSPFRAKSFIDPDDGSAVVVVVNDDTDSERKSTVKILPPVEKVRDLIKGEDLTAKTDEVTGLMQVAISLPAGGGTILLIDNSATARVAPIFVDDFSVQSTPAKWQNAQRVLLPVGWGMGLRVWVQPVVRNGEVELPAWLQYDLSTIAARWREVDGNLVVAYEGSDVE
ncbi:MAG: hypothetical protein N3B10_14065, partial [Armatimonadetes bacterium]|nr:hypothetical protein [Armatimonadota bacterium]